MANDTITRNSLSTPLDTRYNSQTPSNAKLGMDNFIDTANKFSVNFKTPTIMTSQLTDAAQNYSTTTLKVDVTKYKG